VETITGHGGLFYLENVPPGQQKARLFEGEDICEFELTIPDKAGLIYLGTLNCG
jgi:hypothetical protein